MIPRRSISGSINDPNMAVHAMLEPLMHEKIVAAAMAMIEPALDPPHP
jgi:hypothetical protein